MVNSESVISEEVGYAFEHHPARIGVDIRWFRDRYRGLMGLVNKDFANQDEVNVQGGDLTVRWEPRDGTRLRLAYAGNQVQSQDKGGVYSKSVPANTLSLYWNQALLDAINLSLNYQRVSEMFWLDSGQRKRSLPPIDYLNLRLAKRMMIRGRQAELAWVMQNALGHHADYYLGIFGAPENRATRNSFIQFSLEL